MAHEKSRPALGAVRKTEAVGPEYPESHYRNPWNVGIDENYGDEVGASSERDFQSPRILPNDTRTLFSPTSTPVGMHAIDLNAMSDYDSNWEHGVRGGIEAKPRGPRESTRWTPRGGKGK